MKTPKRRLFPSLLCLRRGLGDPTAAYEYAVIRVETAPRALGFPQNPFFRDGSISVEWVAFPPLTRTSFALTGSISAPWVGFSPLTRTSLALAALALDGNGEGSLWTRTSLALVHAKSGGDSLGRSQSSSPLQPHHHASLCFPRCLQSYPDLPQDDTWRCSSSFPSEHLTLAPPLSLSILASCSKHPSAPLAPFGPEPPLLRLLRISP